MKAYTQHSYMVCFPLPFSTVIAPSIVAVCFLFLSYILDPRHRSFLVSHTKMSIKLWVACICVILEAIQTTWVRLVGSWVNSHENQVTMRIIHTSVYLVSVRVPCAMVWYWHESTGYHCTSGYSGHWSFPHLSSRPLCEGLVMRLLHTIHTLGCHAHHSPL